MKAEELHQRCDGCGHREDRWPEVNASFLMVSRDLTKILNDRYSCEAEAQNYFEQLNALTSTPSITAKSRQLASSLPSITRCDLLMSTR